MRVWGLKFGVLQFLRNVTCANFRQSSQNLPVNHSSDLPGMFTKVFSMDITIWNFYWLLKTSLANFRQSLWNLSEIKPRCHGHVNWSVCTVTFIDLKLLSSSWKSNEAHCRHVTGYFRDTSLSGQSSDLVDKFPAAFMRMWPELLLCNDFPLRGSKKSHELVQLQNFCSWQ